MKIIHVAGWSGSGKTTFIISLCSFLKKLGTVGTVKHIGEHTYSLPDGKDTTLHFNSGAFITAGIFLDKTVITQNENDLDNILDLFCDIGVQYTVIEGFKRRTFKKVVIGELTGLAVINNPEPEDILSSLDKFDDWYTIGSLLKNLQEKYPGSNIVSSVRHSRISNLNEVCKSVEEEYSKKPGIEGVCIRVLKPGFEQDSEVCILIATYDLYLVSGYVKEIGRYL